MVAVRPAGIHHVSLNVGDVDEARRFYVEVLGLAERDDRPDFGFPGAWLDAGSQQVHLIHSDEPAPEGAHFALAVGDLEVVVAELRDRGVEVSDPTPVGSSLQAFTKDPSDNLIELHQPG